MASRKLTPAIGANGRTSDTRILEAYGKLPLRFEANRGQTASPVKFLSRGNGYTLFLTRDEAVLNLKKGGSPKNDGNRESTIVRMTLAGANHNPQVSGEVEVPGKSNYFIGNDTSKWHTEIPSYARVRYQGVYPGVDLVYYGNQQQLEYDFVVSSGADPRVIRLAIGGGGKLEVDRGDLVIRAGRDGEIRLRKPVVYQQIRGRRQELAGHYVLHADRTVGFEVPAYDRTQPLIVDPVLAYSTYLGGSLDDLAYGIAVDSAGNAYVTGRTTSLNFPTAAGYQPAFATRGSSDAFVAKLNPSGTGLVYSTYLGGTGGDPPNSSFWETARAIAVDSQGSAYVAGGTSTSDFPTTPGAFQTVPHGSSEAFVVRLAANGASLIYSTYLGGSGSDTAFGVAVDSGGNAYVAGETWSANFPTTSGAFQSTSPGGFANAFVTKLNPGGTGLVYSTFVGGSDGDGAAGIALDLFGNAYITGYTYSADFPVTAGAFQTQRLSTAGQAGFAAALNSSGSALINSTYLDGSLGAAGSSIAVDSAGNAYVAGITSSGNFPVLNPYQATYTNAGSCCTYFLTKLNLSAAAVYSTYLENYTEGVKRIAVAVDSAGSAYVTGVTQNPSFPTVSPIQASKQSASTSGFVCKFSPSGTSLLFSTYLAGSSGASEPAAIAVDSSGNPYITGSTVATNFPTTAGAFAASNSGGYDVFISKIQVPVATTTALTATPATISGNQYVDLKATPTPVSASPNTLTGTVTLMDGAATIATGPLGNLGYVLVSTNALAVGPHTITAVYSGDANFVGSTSAPVNVMVQSVTTTALTATPNPAQLGQNVDLRATISVVGSNPNQPTGTVTVKDGSTVIGTAPLGAQGSVVISTNSLSAGTHSLTAVYSGDANFAGSGSTATSLVVNNFCSTTTRLDVSLNPVIAGQYMHFRVTPSGTSNGCGLPTGTATLKEGSTVVATAPLGANGYATLSINTFSVGTHSVTATYSGDGSFGASTSSTATLVVSNPCATSTTLAATANPVLANQSVGLTAAASGIGTGCGAYNVVELPSSGLPNVYALHPVVMNNHGAVTGYWYPPAGTPLRGFLWTPDDASCANGPGTCVHDLGPGFPDGISDTVPPIVVMVANQPPCFLWRDGVTISYSDGGCGIGINPGGTVVVGGDAQGHFAKWAVAGSWPSVTLQRTSYPAINGQLRSVNDAGIAAGWTTVGCCTPVTFDVNTGQVLTANLVSSFSALGYRAAGRPGPYNSINAAGQVIGTTEQTPPYGGFLYDPVSASGGLALPNLGPMSGYPNGNGQPWGLNNKGQVVGRAAVQAAPNKHAYLYDYVTNKIADLQVLAGRTDVFLWASEGAGINDSGSLVVDGFYYDCCGFLVQRPFLLRPPTGTVTIKEGSTILKTVSVDSAGSIALPPLSSGAHTLTAVYSGDANFAGSTSAAILLTVAAVTTSTDTSASFTEGTTTVSASFNTITSSGATTVTAISPSSAGSLPGGFALTDSSLAFDISTTAGFSGPINICFVVPSVTDPSVFSTMRILHNEGGTLVDRTILDGAYAPNFSAKTICAGVSSLSPFVLVKVIDVTPPAVSANLSANPSPVGATVTLSATAADTNSGNSNIVSIQYSLDNGVTWQPFAGNYTSPAVNVTAALNLPAGVYGVCVRATDAAQNRSSVCSDVLAVYDANGGFVTGGGWINSPAGAYAPNASAAGKATFGFVSKYANGASTPSGDTQFQFDAAGFLFRSKAYEWLVVAGARAQFKGTGTINGAGTYGFLLTAIDGQVPGGGGTDKFRIKIWAINTDGSQGVIYDNQMGASDTDDAGTALGGGSIVIHK